jgi:hypothetical protein
MMIRNKDGEETYGNLTEAKALEIINGFKMKMEQGA